MSGSRVLTRAADERPQCARAITKAVPSVRGGVRAEHRTRHALSKGRPTGIPPCPYLCSNARAQRPQSSTNSITAPARQLASAPRGLPAPRKARRANDATHHINPIVPRRRARRVRIQNAELRAAHRRRALAVIEKLKGLRRTLSCSRPPRIGAVTMRPQHRQTGPAAQYGRHFRYEFLEMEPRAAET